MCAQGGGGIGTSGRHKHGRKESRLTGLHSAIQKQPVTKPNSSRTMFSKLVAVTPKMSMAVGCSSIYVYNFVCPLWAMLAKPVELTRSVAKCWPRHADQSCGSGAQLERIDLITDTFFTLSRNLVALDEFGTSEFLFYIEGG